jgi:hypothetical protein
LIILLEGGKLDHFIDLNRQICDRLNLVKETIEDIRKLERIPGANPNQLITCQSTVRTELTAMNDEWKGIIIKFIPFLFACILRVGFHLSNGNEEKEKQIHSRGIIPKTKNPR